jgi:hypothetical protein
MNYFYDLPIELQIYILDLIPRLRPRLRVNEEWIPRSRIRR